MCASDPLHARKAGLAKLLAKAGDGIQYNEHMEGEIGVAMFEHVCKLGLEGSVEASGPRLSLRPVKQLGQGQEPSLSRNAAG